MGVFTPGIGHTCFRDDGPETRICQYVRPWCRCNLIKSKRNYVLTSVGGKTSGPVKKQKITPGYNRCSATVFGCPYRNQERNIRFTPEHSAYLLFKCSPAITDNHPRGRLNKYTVFVGYLVGGTDKDTS